jgi:hypothetical protein
VGRHLSRTHGGIFLRVRGALLISKVKIIVALEEFHNIFEGFLGAACRDGPNNRIVGNA